MNKACIKEILHIFVNFSKKLLPCLRAGRFFITLVYCVKSPFTLIVIPGLTEPAPYSIRGNPVFSLWARFHPRGGSTPEGGPFGPEAIWIPAGVYPVLDTGRERRLRNLCKEALDGVH